jgi:glycerol-3-phosphate dehydrogenase
LIEKINAFLSNQFPDLKIIAEADSLNRGIVTLSGECNTWQQVIDVGHAVAKLEGVTNVVNDLTVKGMQIPRKDYSPYISQGEKLGTLDEADVVIIGLGITGCAIARALSKYDLKIIF